MSHTGTLEVRYFGIQHVLYPRSPIDVNCLLSQEHSAWIHKSMNYRKFLFILLRFITAGATTTFAHHRKPVDGGRLISKIL